MNKEFIANTCEKLYKECLREIPQYENDELIWILNKKETLNKEEWETIGVINKNIRRQGYNITNKY